MPVEVRAFLPLALSLALIATPGSGNLLEVTRPLMRQDSAAGPGALAGAAPPLGEAESSPEVPVVVCSGDSCAETRLTPLAPSSTRLNTAAPQQRIRVANRENRLEFSKAR